MYSLIMIDDEMFSVNSFKNAIDYKNFGFDLKASFINPYEAMDYIENNKVDVIVTDIKMHGISGIDIAHYCFYNSPDTKIIFLSGYNDFDYARQGIKYKVHAYLTKPVTSAVLAQTFSELYTLLSSRQPEKQFLPDSVNELLRTYFMKIISGNLSNIDNDINALREIGFDISTDSSIFAALSMSIGNYDNYSSNVWKHSKKQLVDALEHLINKEHQCGYSGLTLFHESGFDIFFISKPGVSMDSFRQFIDTYVASVYNMLSECLKMDTSLNDLFISGNIADFKHYYEELDNKKSDMALSKKQHIILNAKKYIDTHYNENITLDTVAELSAFNTKYFSKLFNEYFKMSFSDYLQKTRLEAAKKLLTDSNSKVTSIPPLIGLSSFSTFSKSFKKYTGYSPSEYKDKFRKM